MPTKTERVYQVTAKVDRRTFEGFTSRSWTTVRYEKIKTIKLQGASPATLAAVDRIQPYHGGNDLLWALHRLNNIEKHRVLLTVGSAVAGVDLARIMTRTAEGHPNPDVAWMAEGMEGIEAFYGVTDTGFHCSQVSKSSPICPASHRARRRSGSESS